MEPLQVLDSSPLRLCVWFASSTSQNKWAPRYARVSWSVVSAHSGDVRLSATGVLRSRSIT